MLRALGIASFAVATAIAQTNFPAPPAPPGNPPSPMKELLGMTLFFEEQLSSTGTVACATCHEFQHGGGDSRTSQHVNPGPDGVFGTADDQRGSAGVGLVLGNGTMIPAPVTGFGPRVTGRRSPTVINSGYHTHLAYDGSKQSLEALVAAPIMNVIEMGHASRTWADVAQKLGAATPLVFASNLPTRLQNFVAGRTYPQLFQLAFGIPTISQQSITFALSSYVRTLNSDQSKWDLHLHGQAQLTPQEQLGLQLFNTPAAGATACSTCHGDFDQRVLTEGPVAGQMTMVTSGYYGSPTPARLVFHNIGIRPPAEDPGRQQVTSASLDAGSFRIASLRNVELNGPYFHNGSANTLQDVLDFYDRGGDFHVNQAPSLLPRNYTVGEKAAIIALLQTLTDPRVAAATYPFDRPTLGSQNGRLVTSIGHGSTTTSGQLTARAPFAPRLGDAWFKLTLEGAPPFTPAFLMWDQAVASGQPFNLQLAVSPAFLMVGMGAMDFTFTTTSGVKQVPMPLPNTPALSGLTLFAQWLALAPSEHGPFALSNALRMQLL